LPPLRPALIQIAPVKRAGHRAPLRAVEEIGADHEVDRRLERLGRHFKPVRPHAHVAYVDQSASRERFDVGRGDALEDRPGDAFIRRIVDESMHLRHRSEETDDGWRVLPEPGIPADDRCEDDLRDRVGHFAKQAEALVRRKEIPRRRLRRAVDLAGLQCVETLSGGQRQAVAVARAVAFGSKVIVLDEPTAALGVREGNQVLAIVGQLRSRGLAIILISHNMPHVFEIADRVHIQRLGKCAGVITPKTHTMPQAVAIMTGAMSVGDTFPGTPEATHRASNASGD
jgi:hypothetical protein